MTSITGNSYLDSLANAQSKAGTNAPAASKQTVDQAGFLKLLTAQLKTQDPTQPVDNTQMVAQMAQLSSVTGISQMNTTLSSIAAKLGATSATDAMGYVGKTVLTTGSTAYARTFGGIAGAVELDGDATDVNVTISDANGSVLKTVGLGKQKAGTVSYDWDGTTDAGGTAEGPFTVSVAADNNGTTVPNRSLVWAPVESVSLPSGGDPVLSVTGLGSVKLADVRSVG